MASLSISLSTFPLTTIGIPIATVCPLQTSSTAYNSRFVSVSTADITQPFSPVVTSQLSQITVTIATAPLPNGTLTTFSTLRPRRLDERVESAVDTPLTPIILPGGITGIPLFDLDDSISSSDAPNLNLGTIVMGNEGCQTLYTPTVMALCSTIVSPVGIPPVTITDCGQYVTFSSETLVSCAATSEVVPRPAETGMTSAGSVSASAGNSGIDMGSSIILESNLGGNSFMTSSVASLGLATSSMQASETMSESASLSVSMAVGDVPVENTVSTSIAPSTTSTSTFSTSDSTTATVPISTNSFDDPIKISITTIPEETAATPTVPSTSATSNTITSSASLSFTNTNTNTTTTEPSTPKSIQILARRNAEDPREDPEDDPEADETFDSNETFEEYIEDQQPILVYSSAPSDEIPMSIPRQLLPDYGIKKRSPQVLVSGGRPFLTELVTVTPDVALETEMGETGRVERRQVTRTVVGFSVVDGIDAAMMAEPTSMAAVDGGVGVGVSMSAAMTTGTADDMDVGTMSIAADMTMTTPMSDVLPESTSVSMEFGLPDGTAITTDTIDLDNKNVNLSPPQPTKYYAAPWSQLIPGSPFPTNVKGITCRGGLEPAGSCVTPDTDGDTESCECDVDDEIWSVTSITRTRIGTTVISFDGGVVVTLDGGVVLTTEVSFTSVMTTTREDVVGRVVRSTVTKSVSSSVEPTVYIATETTFPSVTMTMLPGDGPGTSMVADATSVPLMESSSVVDAAAPQESAASVSGAGDLSTINGIDGTTMITSTIATETVTVPATDVFETDRASPMPTDEMGADVSGGETASMTFGDETGAPSIAARDSWPTDVWMVDIAGSTGAVENDTA